MLAPRLNGVGLMKRWKCANRNPATAAYSAAMTKTVRLRRTVSMPTLSPISRAPFSVRIARPMRLSSKLADIAMMTATAAQMTPRLTRRLAADSGPRLQRRDVADAVEAVQQRQRAEQREEADAPGDRDQRQEMAGQPRGDQPEQPGDRAGQHQAGGQAGDRRRAGELGEQCRGVGGEADEARLAERGLAADPGQQHQAERDQRGQADIAEQGDVEGGQQRGHQHDQDSGGER